MPRARCFVCTLLEQFEQALASEDARDPGRARELVARALAMGSKVLAGRGTGLATCTICHRLLARELNDVGAELAAGRRRARG